VSMSQLIAVSRKEGGPTAGFPFDVPAIRSLGELDLGASVTLFVGENGSGKSTLLESLAIAAGLPAVGSGGLARDPTLVAQRRLADSLRLVWKARNHRGFFLRAEDFFGFQKEVVRGRAEHEAELRRLDLELREADQADRDRALGVHRGSIEALRSRYGDDPDARSHGEAFLALFKARLVPGGVFMLDEPEAALSPQSQLGFLSMIRHAVEEGGQFVIATHSPILMAIPGATVYAFEGGEIVRSSFDELEAVALVRDFLQSPQRFLRHIWDVTPGDP
jgi:predicted ATPase